MAGWYEDLARKLALLASCCLLLVVIGCSVDGTRVRKQGIAEEADANVKIEPEVQENFNQGVEHLKQGNYEQAIKLFRKVVKRAKRHTSPFINLGIAYKNSGELGKAEESFLSALELNPGHVVANNELGMIYRKTGRFSKARGAYKTALDTLPEYQPARKNLGILCDVYIGDLKCAMKYFTEYLEYSPSDEQVKIWIADLNNRM